MKRGRMGKPEAEPAAPLFERPDSLTVIGQCRECGAQVLNPMRHNAHCSAYVPPDPLPWSEHQRLLADALRPKEEK